MTGAIEPDAVVQTALRLLPIPPHGDDFWADLEASLDDETPMPLVLERRAPVLVGALPGALAPLVDLEPDSSLAVVPPAFRRVSNAVLVAVAAAAVVVIGVAGRALLDERRADSGVTSDRLSAGAGLETLMRDAQGDDATLSPLSDEHQSASTDAVLAWIDDLARGEAGGAWAAMGRTSRAHFSSQTEFTAMMTDLAEGYGAWSSAEPDDVLVTPVREDDDGTIAVVTLLGTVEQEGTSHERADAFPVRLVDGDVILEPFASAGDLEVVVPEPVDDHGTTFEAVGVDEALVFVLPTSAEPPVLRIDGGDTVVCGEAAGTDLHDLEGATGQRCSYLPDGGFEPGEHVVTVAFLGPDAASVTADSLRFAAA